MGVTEGCEFQAGAGQETVEEGGPVLHPLEPGLHERGELADVAFGQVGEGSLEVRPHQLDRVELVGIGRQLEDRQRVPGRDQLGHGGADALLVHSAAKVTLREQSDYRVFLEVSDRFIKMLGRFAAEVGGKFFPCGCDVARDASIEVVQLR